MFMSHVVSFNLIQTYKEEIFLFIFDESIDLKHKFSFEIFDFFKYSNKKLKL